MNHDIPAQDDSRFVWSYDRTECYDLSPGGLTWKMHSVKDRTGRYSFRFHSQGHKTPPCTRLYTARRALMRLIAKLDEERKQ